MISTKYQSIGRLNKIKGKEEHDYVYKYIFPGIGKIRTSKEVALSLR